MAQDDRYGERGGRGGQEDQDSGREDRTSLAGFMLRRGEAFGWAALLEDHPRRIARAACLEPSVVLRISGAKALELLEADPAAGYLVMRQLSQLIARQLHSTGIK